MAAMAKIAAFAALLRVLTVAFHLQLQYWRPIVIALAVLSLVFGAIFALRQREIKRMLAYSSKNTCKGSPNTGGDENSCAAIIQTAPG